MEKIASKTLSFLCTLSVTPGNRHVKAGNVAISTRTVKVKQNLPTLQSSVFHILQRFASKENQEKRPVKFVIITDRKIQLSYLYVLPLNASYVGPQTMVNLLIVSRKVIKVIFHKGHSR